MAPSRVNVIPAGFVDITLPIGRLTGPTDVSALAMHIMTNTALTGVIYDIDGGQQLISGE